MTPSSEQKTEILTKLGLNLKECKIRDEDLNPLVDILYEFEDVFDVENPPKDPIPNFRYKIPLKDDIPVWSRNYKMRYDIQEQLEQHVQKLLKAGIIEKAVSPYNNPVLCLSKPNGGTRLCLDLRKLNAKVVQNFNYLHNAENAIQKIMQYRASMYSQFDLKEAFFSMKLDESSRQAVAFNLGSGSHVFTRLVMGLSSSPSVFCQIINQIFEGMGDFLQYYLDDMVFADKSVEKHLEHIKLNCKECVITTFE